MNKDVLALAQKMARAEVALKAAKRTHRDNCPVESDPEGMAPCNCGASQTNTEIDKALRELRLD